MKSQWIVLIVVAVILVVGGLVLTLTRKSHDLDSYLPLKEPRIRARADERVLEVAFSGPADTVIKEAYSVLFKTYFGLKGRPKGPAMKPPKARYADIAAALAAPPSVEELKIRDWTGSVAIPIPEDLALPEARPDSEGLVARAAIWKYGEVAEILHLGSYESEPPTIERLAKYIAERGYKIVGDHEEEYLRGPGTLFVAPKGYWTIIRYRVEKVR
jgi:hypothetical protein